MWETVLAAGTAKGTAPLHRPPGGWERSWAGQALHCLNEQRKGGGGKGEGRRNRAPKDFGEAECSLVVFSVSGEIFSKVPIATHGSLSGFFRGRGGAGLEVVLSYSWGLESYIIHLKSPCRVAEGVSRKGSHIWND